MFFVGLNLGKKNILKEAILEAAVYDPRVCMICVSVSAVS